MSLATLPSRAACVEASASAPFSDFRRASFSRAMTSPLARLSPSSRLHFPLAFPPRFLRASPPLFRHWPRTAPRNRDEKWKYRWTERRARCTSPSRVGCGLRNARSRSLSLTEILAHLSASAKGHRGTHGVPSIPGHSAFLGINHRPLHHSHRVVVARTTRRARKWLSAAFRDSRNAITNSQAVLAPFRTALRADKVNKGYLRRNTSNKWRVPQRWTKKTSEELM